MLLFPEIVQFLTMRSIELNDLQPYENVNEFEVLRGDKEFITVTQNRRMAKHRIFSVKYMLMMY